MVGFLACWGDRDRASFSAGLNPAKLGLRDETRELAKWDPAIKVMKIDKSAVFMEGSVSTR